MTAINPSAIAMAAFGFAFLFGGLAVTLWIALRSGGFSDEAEDERNDPTADGSS